MADKAIPSQTDAPAAIDTRFGRLSDRVLGIAASVILFVIMVLSFFDVIGRELLSQPIYGAYEMTEFLMGLLIFTALPVLCAREGHVTIDLFDSVIPKSWVRWQRIVVNFICALTIALMAWRLYIEGVTLLSHNEVTMTLKVNKGPFGIFFGVMSVVAVVATLFTCWSYLRNRAPIQTPVAS
ncbi:MAG: TRAP transporter small permease [Alphaproteobacteria bacterium]